MSDRGRLALSVLTILAVALLVWLPTINWGLPSREADKYLFGDRRPWTGAEIIASTATTRPATARGADVDADPILDRSRPVILNDTDAKRAAIVRRYRLMSGQPDEFIQFKALSEMAARPGLAKLDPRLYQYGGLWMYPIGAMIRAAMLVGIIETPPPGTPALGFYLDRPDAFGRFYVVARFYSWCWGIVAALAIVWLARRLTGSIGLATLAAVAFMLTPVVRAATHEAKPHLAGAALCLCAVIAATRYVDTGRRRWAIAAGALCGAAMAMVVSMLLSLVVLPVMAWLRWREEKTRTPNIGRPTRNAEGEGVPSALDVGRSMVGVRLPASDGALTPTLSPCAGERGPSLLRSIVVPLFASLAVAAIVYAATNPFVLINAVAQPDILRSNLGNSTAMYGVGDFVDAAANSLRVSIVAMTATGLVATMGCIVALIIAVARRRPIASPGSRHVVLILAAPTVCILIQFICLAAGKPAEYARFGLIIVATLFVAAATALEHEAMRNGCLAALMGVALWADVMLSVRAAQDRHRGSVTHALMSGSLATAPHDAPLMIGVAYEPAPWSCPPIDLFGSRIILTRFQPWDVAPYDVYVWPSNLATQAGFFWTAEEVDWRRNVHIARGGRRSRQTAPASTRPHDVAINSDSDPAGYRSASRTAPASPAR